jgi:hypothetical protein
MQVLLVLLVVLDYKCIDLDKLYQSRFGHKNGDQIVGTQKY